MRVYFVLWVIIQYYVISSVAKIVLALTTGGSFRWFFLSFSGEMGEVSRNPLSGPP